jgi:hypothetical protein
MLKVRVQLRQAWPSFSRMPLERAAIGSDSLVGEKTKAVSGMFSSTMGHVKSHGKLGGPPSKAKYHPATDSE